jgi:hypothetical protein
MLSVASIHSSQQEFKERIAPNVIATLNEEEYYRMSCSRIERL